MTLAASSRTAPLQGGPDAVRYARRRSLLLLTPLLFLAVVGSYLPLISSEGVTKNRYRATVAAWTSAHPEVAAELQGCMKRQGQFRAVQKRRGDFMVHLSLLEDVRVCEDSVAKSAIARGAVFGEAGVAPVADYEAATAARKAVFDHTWQVNPADLQFHDRSRTSP